MNVMLCPLCGWGSKLVKEWNSHGYACAIYRCEDCECDVAAKTPIEKFKKGKWVCEETLKENDEPIVAEWREVMEIDEEE